MYICVSLCEYGYMSVGHMEARRGTGAPGAGVPGGSHGFWGPKLSPLKEQPVLLASGLSFQPTCLLIF